MSHTSPSEPSFVLTLSQVTRMLEAAGAPGDNVNSLLLLMAVGAVRRSPSSQQRPHAASAAPSDRLQEGSTSPSSRGTRQRQSFRASAVPDPPESQIGGINDLSLHFGTACAIVQPPSISGPGHSTSSSRPIEGPEDFSQRSTSRLEAIAEALQSIPQPSPNSPPSGKEWFAIVVGERVGVVFSW